MIISLAQQRQQYQQQQHQQQQHQQQSQPCHEQLHHQRQSPQFTTTLTATAPYQGPYHHQQNHSLSQEQQKKHKTPIFNGVNQNYPGLRQIYYDPPIFVVDEFLNEKETDFLIEAASDSFTPAPVVGVGNGVISETRTSSTCYLAKEEVPDLTRKIASLTQKPIIHMELPQVGRYFTSQQYLPHYDAFNADEADGARFAANGGQRTVTVLIYLNDVARGGHTSFPQLGPLNIHPVRGTALVFFPATVDGHLDPRALHAALPAVDTKFVSQIWIRQGNYYGQPSKRLPEIMGTPLTPEDKQAYCQTVGTVFQKAGDNNNTNSGVAGVGGIAN